MTEEQMSFDDEPGGVAAYHWPDVDPLRLRKVLCSCGESFHSLGGWGHHVDDLVVARIMERPEHIEGRAGRRWTSQEAAARTRRTFKTNIGLTLKWIGERGRAGATDHELFEAHPGRWRSANLAASTRNALYEHHWVKPLVNPDGTEVMRLNRYGNVCMVWVVPPLMRDAWEQWMTETKEKEQ